MRKIKNAKSLIQQGISAFFGHTSVKLGIIPNMGSCFQYCHYFLREGKINFLEEPFDIDISWQAREFDTCLAIKRP